MNDMTGIALLVGCCILVLMIVFLKRKSWYIIKFITRAMMGMAAIVMINQLIGYMGFPALCVGVNVISFLTCGILGFPGLVALYGFMGYKIL